MAPDYGKLHQMLLQSIQSRSVVTRANVKERLKEIASILGNVSQVKITEDDLTEVINEINFKISPFGMELKEVLSEYNAEKFIVLINTVDCSCTQERIDHKYTVREREVFRVLLEAIVQSETYGSISSTDALHLHVPNTPFRVGEMEELLERLKADKWFIETESGHIAPGVRCIAEFEPYLKKNFEDYVQDCPLCSNVVFYGVLCPHCDAITHKHCFRNYNSRKGGNSRICPKQTCKKFIPDERNGGDLYEEQNHEENNSSVVRKRLPKSQRSNCTAKPLHNKSSLSGTDDSMDVDDGTLDHPELTVSTKLLDKYLVFVSAFLIVFLYNIGSGKSFYFNIYVFMALCLYS